MFTGNMDFVHCPTDDIILDASSTTGGQSYAYHLKRGTAKLVCQRIRPLLTLFLPATVSDGDTIGVIAYSGLAGAGCSNAVSETIRYQ